MTAKMFTRFTRPLTGRRSTLVGLWFFVAASLLATAPAYAGLGGFSRRTVTYLNPGVEMGATANLASGHLGASLAVRMSLNDVVESPLPSAWKGLYGHLGRDFGRDAWRGGIGVGTGVLMFGAEVGAVGVVDDDGSSMGLELAGLATIGFCGAYVRHTHLVERPSITEIGIRFGMPVKSS